jgi:hypothetical protein
MKILRHAHKAGDMTESFLDEQGLLIRALFLRSACGFLIDFVTDHRSFGRLHPRTVINEPKYRDVFGYLRSIIRRTAVKLPALR